MIINKSYICQVIGNILTPTEHDWNKWERKNKWLRGSKMTIGQHVNICRSLFVLSKHEHNVFIEDYVSIGEFVKFWAFNKIKIDKFAMIASDVSFINGGHETDTFMPHSRPLYIGKGTWIGTGTKILQGVNIGNNVIIGGGSVVVHDIPDNAIAVGNPAKIIKYRKLPTKVWHQGSIYFCPKTFELIE